MKAGRLNSLRNQDGFTLAEVTVALAVTGIIIGLAFKLYVFAHQSLVLWQDRMALEVTCKRITTAIMDDLMLSRQLVEAETESVKMIDSKRKIRSWSVESNRLLRDGEDALAANMRVKNVHLQYFDAEGNELANNPVLPLISRVAIEIMLQKKELTFTLYSSTGLRNKREYAVSR
jgi:prepilin-type N-terminal cleavage/methylation domain-containing protein